MKASTNFCNRSFCFLSSWFAWTCLLSQIQTLLWLKPFFAFNLLSQMDLGISWGSWNKMWGAGVDGWRKWWAAHFRRQGRGKTANVNGWWGGKKPGDCCGPAAADWSRGRWSNSVPTARSMEWQVIGGMAEIRRLEEQNPRTVFLHIKQSFRRP